MKTRITSILIILCIMIISLSCNSNIFRLIILLCTWGCFSELFHLKQKDKSDKLELIKWIGYIGLALILYNDYYFHFNIIALFISVILSYIIPIIFYNDNKKYNINDALYLVGITMFLSISFGSIIYFQNTDINKYIYLLIIALGTDLYNNIGNKLIGKHQLVKNTTWEGVITGVIMGSMIGSVYYYNVIGSISFVIIIIFSILLSLLAVTGGLAFSSIKKYYPSNYYHRISKEKGLTSFFDSILFVALGMMIILNLF